MSSKNIFYYWRNLYSNAIAKMESDAHFVQSNLGEEPASEMSVGSTAECPCGGYPERQPTHDIVLDGKPVKYDIRHYYALGGAMKDDVIHCAGVVLLTAYCLFAVGAMLFVLCCL